MAWLHTDSDAVIHIGGGRSFSFKAGVAREVREQFLDELIAKGCSTLDSVEEETPKTESKLEGLEAVLSDIIERGDPGEFKSDGTPNVNIVNSLLGRRLSAREVTSCFREMMSNDGS